MSRPRARALAGATVSLTACLGLLAACGGESDGTSEASASSSPTSSSSTSSPTATASSDPTASSSAPTSPGAPTTLRGRLLTAEELPGFNDQYRWAAGATTAVEPTTPFGTCQRFDITSIGAERVVVRRYKPAVADPAAAKDRGGELVAKFPDEMTARRAYQVLLAWRGRCGELLKRFARSEVGALQNVSVPGARASWYLLQYGPVPGQADAGYFDAQGMVLSGDRIAMVSMVLAGQDYNYEPGQEPMVAALEKAAQKLS